LAALDNIFTTIRVQGAILPPDLLHRVVSGDTALGGLTPLEYHLAEGEKLNEAINRSWNRLSGLWSHFRTASLALPESDLGTTVTRERWLLPLFQELGYGRLQTVRAIEVKGKSFAISHTWGHAPIHLVGYRVDLDVKKTGVAGAARSSPHSLVQELLNTSEAHLWALVSNGLTLRILRDNASLVRQAYVEFDLEAMFDSQAYPDFVLLWLLCHQSRVESERPEGCWLERWSKNAQEQGARALEVLRDGVEKAIAALGSGFLKHAANQTLKDKLRLARLSTQDYYRQVLRLVYRLLFLFVAEDRDLLLIPDASPEVRSRYLKYYSTSRLRRLANRLRGTRHTDLYQTLRLVTAKLGSDTGCPELGLPALDGFLFSIDALTDLESCELSNSDLLDAIRALAFLKNENGRRPVDYKHLRSEELGSVYEALLELHPRLNTDAGAFELTTAAGHERKQTGTYYTPDSLVLCLLDSALDHVLEDACRKPNPEEAILQLKVCDPACGSGHFPIAAAHRIAKRLGSIRTGDEEPAPSAMQKALRDVISKCIYGVDQNPMAVELCKVALWMESLEPGKPLSFLDHHIQCGNSLLGTTPALLKNGIPDEAFIPIEGDDKELCKAYKKQNKEERKGIQSLPFDQPHSWIQLDNLATAMMTLETMSDDTVGGVRRKQEQYEELVRSSQYLYSRLLADAWCAAFVWKKTQAPSLPYSITENVFRKMESNPLSTPDWMKGEIQRRTEEYKFFHWHLAFPDVFRVPTKNEIPENNTAGWSGGFDVVLGNPPWERVKLQEKEWFAEHNPQIAHARNRAVRKRLIEALKSSDPILYQRFLADLRMAEGESHLIRNSGRYPLCGRGDINTYAVFAEGMRTLLNEGGRNGCVLPTGIATDDTTKFFFQNVLETQSLVSLFSFENEEFVFPAVHHATRFCLFTVGSGARPLTNATEFVFFARQVDHLRDPNRRFSLSVGDIALLNPNTRTSPVFRSLKDAVLTKAIYRRVPVLVRETSNTIPEENPWNIHFSTMFHMSNDSHHFRTREYLETDGWVLNGNIFRKDGMQCLPLYEAKMIHQFDHRWGTYEGQSVAQANQGKLPEFDTAMHADPTLRSLPRYWVADEVIDDYFGEIRKRRWLLGWRDICRATDIRTTIAAVFSPANSEGGLLLAGSSISATCLASFFGCLNSFIFDFVSRQKVGGSHLKFFTMRQQPVVHPDKLNEYSPWKSTEVLRDSLLSRVLELTYTAWDLESFAQDCGWFGPPFRWDEERRFLLRCELDAAFFHVYLPLDPMGDWRQEDGESAVDLALLKASFPTPRDAVACIMDTFPIVKRKDEERFGEYRTKRVILEIYDAMGEAIRTGRPYGTMLDPPPGPPAELLPDWPAGAPHPANWPSHIHPPRHATGIR